MTRPPTAGLREFWEQPTLYMPERPLCTNSWIEGTFRRAREQALAGYRYIEANPATVSDLLVVDIDDPQARLLALWQHGGMLPNLLTVNPANGHAHAVWALAAPFARTEYARRKPLAYAAAVTEGLRRSCDGDTGYSGLMTKNPLHDAWEAELVTEHLYTLDELAGRLEESGDLPPASWKRTKRRNVTGLGRNCHVFETARTWAYREVRHHWGDSDGLHDAIRGCCHDINRDQFAASPLPMGEVDQIAKSIHKWIVTQSRMWRDGPAVYEATFIAIQSARGHKGGRASAIDRVQRFEDKRKRFLQEVLGNGNDQGQAAHHG